ncbi:MAG: ABC transporter ATP-binding protein [Woeseiaceae bacterium]
MSAASKRESIPIREVFRLSLRCWPYYRPMLKHLLTFLFLNVLMAALFMGIYFVGNDLIENKILVGERLQSMQATILMVGDEYVTTGAEDEPPLTDEQRKRVRLGVIVVAAMLWVYFAVYLAASTYYHAWIFQQINQRLRVEMLGQVERLSLRYHSESRTGDAMYRVYQDSATIVNILQFLIFTPMRLVLWSIFSIIVLMFFSPWFGLIILIAAIPITYVMRRLIPKVRKYAQLARETNSDLTSRIQETLAAIRVVKANAAEKEMMARFKRDSTAALEAAYKFRFYMSILMLGVLLCSFTAFLVAEYYMATWALAEKATFLGGAVALLGFAVWNLGAYRSATGRGEEISNSMWDIAYHWSLVQDLAVGLKRAFYFIDMEPEVDEPENPHHFPDKLELVRYENTSFSYQDDMPVLGGVDLQANAGTVTAIVGGTGSGKSTMMSLLLRLYDPDAGRVLINDTDLRDMGVSDLRSNVAIALQQNVLFAMSVADNIRYGHDDVADEKVVAAAKIACADDFVSEMPNGYDTELGERGGKLSTGQRQRLSIARAVLRDTPILILDEPTASLDAETEQRVLANLAKWGAERVVFIITHRLSTIRNADQIAFLADGVIKELGTHEELIQEQGAYQKFVEAEIGD